MRDDRDGRDDRDDGVRFWFNPRTGEVEEGRLSPWGDRMGPYPTREAAQRALQTAQDRTEAWDEADRRWKDDDWPDE